jgi:hypothetical protein
VAIALFADSFFDPVADRLWIPRSQTADARTRRDWPVLQAAGCTMKLLK